MDQKNSAVVQSSCSNGALRLTYMFLELLEKQFPIGSVKQEMACRFPADFSGSLLVHVNHLNKCLKEITGKTTSQLIAERIMKEACALLSFTEWNICEIGCCLGFDEGPHFINFFKKNINTSPTAYRKIVRSKNQDILQTETFPEALVYKNFAQRDLNYA